MDTITHIYIFKSTSLREARPGNASAQSVFNNLNPLASGRLDVYDNDNYDMVSDLNPLASGRLDRLLRQPDCYQNYLNPLASGRLDRPHGLFIINKCKI